MTQRIEGFHSEKVLLRMKAKKPACFGQENDDMKYVRKYGNDSTLPTPLRSHRASASYNWKTRADLKLANLDIDFCPPSVEESWSWGVGQLSVRQRRTMDA